MSQERSAFSDAASRAVLDAAPEGILVVNREGQIVRVNTQTEELFGYGPDGLLDLQFEVLVPELFREEYERQIAGYTLAPGLRPGRVGLELRGRRKDGTEVLLEMSLCFRGRSGRTVGVLHSSKNHWSRALRAAGQGNGGALPSDGGKQPRHSR